MIKTSKMTRNTVDIIETKLLNKADLLFHIIRYFIPKANFILVCLAFCMFTILTMLVGAAIFNTETVFWTQSCVVEKKDDTYTIYCLNPVTFFLQEKELTDSELDNYKVYNLKYKTNIITCEGKRTRLSRTNPKNAVLDCKIPVDNN